MSREEHDRYFGHAAYYGLLLRQQGYAPDEAAALVIAAYPATRPQLERLLQRADPLPDRPEEPR